MKRVVFRLLRIGSVVLAAASVLYLFLICSFTDDPRGMYASWEFFPHHYNDVLRFEDGKVTLETCCGNEAYGTYAKDENGKWVWTHQSQRRPADRSKWHLTEPEYYCLERRFFHLRICCKDRPLVELDMRRRLFNAFPL